MATDNNITAPNINTVDVGNAGEFYAMSLFIRMGFITAKAPEGTADYDLMVMSNDGYSFKPIQVKTITDGEHWLLRQRHELVNENLIFCFIHLTDIRTIPRVFLVPSHVVSYVISMCHQIYMALPNRHGGAHRDSQMRTLKFDFSTLIRNVENPSQYLSSNQLNFLTQYSDGWLDDYEYNFEIINS